MAPAQRTESLLRNYIELYESCKWHSRVGLRGAKRGTKQSDVVDWLAVATRACDFSSANLGQVFHPFGEVLDAIQFDFLNGDLVIPDLPIHQLLHCVLDAQT